MPINDPPEVKYARQEHIATALKGRLYEWTALVAIVESDLRKRGYDPSEVEYAVTSLLSSIAWIELSRNSRGGQAA